MQRPTIILGGTLASLSLAFAFAQVRASLPFPALATVQSGARTTPLASVSTRQMTVLWSADMESAGATGPDLGQWVRSGSRSSREEGGGLFNSGSASARTSFDVNHTPGGKTSAMLTISTPNNPTSGARLFRWFEPQTYPDLYYSTWYYFPRVYTPNGDPAWWNVFQWKSKHPVAAGFSVDPVFVLNIGETVYQGRDLMYFYLCPPPFDDIGRGLGQCVGQQPRRTFVPVKAWTRVEAHYVCAASQKGEVALWEDGTQLFDFSNVATAYPGGDCQWSVNNYSNGLSPSPAIIYLDDAAICSGGRCP